ncbi:MAG: FHA domain-containing protein [Deltaproteobacteria bacterium]|nr:FHA domain-containing protein [Deltaproteobacteria bacterium]
MDQNKKTMRHFYCRDVLWETFEQMANDFDCSIDYLINEAMRYYARSKNYHAAQATGGEFRTGLSSGDVRPAGMATTPPAAPPEFGAAGGTPPQVPAASPPGHSGAVRRTMPPPPPGTNRPGSVTASSASPSPYPQGSPSQLTTPAAQPGRRPSPPSRSTAEPLASAPAPTLFLIFNNQRISIDKDQFIIGRGSKTSDLPIKDGNISRKHAAVIRRNGTYYIKDLGSTNGIDYKGMRIDNKRIDEGDVFHLCDYELRFTYRA